MDRGTGPILALMRCHELEASAVPRRFPFGSDCGLLQDGSGFLSADEVAAAIGNTDNLSEEDLRALIREHDINGDGVIDYTGGASSAALLCTRSCREYNGSTTHSLGKVWADHGQSFWWHLIEMCSSVLMYCLLTSMFLGKPAALVTSLPFLLDCRVHHHASGE